MNLTTQLPFLRDISKLVAGIPHQRKIPAFAPETFKSWFHRRSRPQTCGDSRRPRTSGSGAPQASTRLKLPLQRTGGPSFSGPTPSTTIFTPRRPSRRRSPGIRRFPSHRSRKPTSAADAPSTTLACWTAPNRCFSQILDELAPEIEAGIPIIGLEPSCVAVFRDELINLFPHDERAQALSRRSSAERIPGSLATPRPAPVPAKDLSTATAITNPS